MAGHAAATGSGEVEPIPLRAFSTDSVPCSLSHCSSVQTEKRGSTAQVSQAHRGSPESHRNTGSSPSHVRKDIKLTGPVAST